ncbi:MAG: flagellar filament capping protein FliD [Candidatus Scalindua sp.]
MPGTSSIGGLVSGLDTASLIDQLISVSKKRIDVVVANQTSKKDKIESFQGFNLQLTDLQSDANTLKDSDTFNVFKTSTSTDSATFAADNLATVTTTTDASPGTHTIAFSAGSQLAKARQISSQSFSSFTDARSLTGEILINGSVIKIASTDSLEDISVKINNANSGTNATKVTASIISVSATDNRLVLTSDDTGKDKFNILSASATDILTSLGFTTGDAIKNTTSDGAESDEFSNSQTAVGSLLGLTNPQSNTVTIAGQALAINLSTQSLTTIASNINALTNVTAAVVPTTTDGVTTYKIDISGTTSFTDTDNILETLGIKVGAQAAIAEVHTTATANNKTGGGAIDSLTTFDSIDTTGVPGNDVANGDTITMSGTDHDGNAVTGSYTIADKTTNTIGNLLTAIQNMFKSVDATNTVTASVNGSGQIVVTDTFGGDSQITFNIVANNNVGNGTLDFGTATATTEGYSMQTTAGQDLKVQIDGVNVIRSSNSIDDVITGATLDIARVESGSTVDVNISRDTDSIKTSVNNFITKYNSVIEFINTEFKFNEDLDSAGTLSGEGTLSTIKTSIQSIITGTISLLPAGENAISLIGITSDSDGKLTLNDSTFLSEINSDFNKVKRLFIAEGTATNSEVTYIGHTNKTSAGDYNVNITQAATKAGETGELGLSSGLGAGKQETIRITDTASGRIATIALDGDTTTGNSIDNIISTINSALDTETTQTLAGSVANTAISTGLAITSSTKFNDITGAGLSNNDTITFTGTTRQGVAVNGSYQISDVTTNTVQNFLSAIEDDYGNAVSATINSSGIIILTDNTIGDSLLSISITEPASLNFGTVLTTNTGGVTGRYAVEITASKNANNQLVITNDNYGSAQGFTIAQVAGTDPVAGNEVLIGSKANTLTAGGNIVAGSFFGDINTTGGPGNDITNTAVISYSGTDNGGTAKSGSYTIADKTTNTIQNMLTQIETDFGLTAGSLTISGGKIVVTDDTAGVSQLGITFTFDKNAGSLSFGTFASQDTGIANGVEAGIDVAGTINGEAATGTGQLLKGVKPGTGQTSSIEGLAIKVTSTTESLIGSVANTTDGTTAITSTTAFSGINGASVVANDTITISGKKHDGTPVNYIYTINPTSTTVDNLLTSIESNFGLSASGATIDSSGKISISDTFTGDSQLSITLTENNEGGGSLNFGAITPGAKDTAKLTMGVAETMYNKLVTFTDPIDGLVTIRIDGLGDTVDNLQETIDGMNERLAMESLKLNNKFVQLELNLSKLQNVSSFLAQQLAQLSK